MNIEDVIDEMEQYEEAELLWLEEKGEWEAYALDSKVDWIGFADNPVDAWERAKNNKKVLDI